MLLILRPLLSVVFIISAMRTLSQRKRPIVIEEIPLTEEPHWTIKSPFDELGQDLKGYVGIVDDVEHEIDVDDLQNDKFVKPYPNATVAIVENGETTDNSYRSKRMIKPDNSEDISVSDYYRKRRRPEDEDEDRSKTGNNERRRPNNDENRRRSNDNERRGRPDAGENRRTSNDNKRWRRPDADKDKRRPNDNERPSNDDEHKKKPNDKGIRGSGRNCQSCGKMMGVEGEMGRVINGRVVQPVFKYPWIVSLRDLKDPNKIFCGGAIISATYILTAGHCVVNLDKLSLPECQQGITQKICFYQPKEISLNLLGARQNSKPRPVEIAKIIAHDKFDFHKLLNDMALIKLASPIECNQLASPICLPKGRLGKFGGQLIIAGWGFNTGEGNSNPQLLREGVMKQVRPRVCKRMSWTFHPALADIICATGTKTGYSSCKGDSGSSIFAQFGNKVYTLGVSSQHASLKCQLNLPVTYTKVRRYMGWIQKHVKDLPRSQ